jgi:hypothetical protein
MSTTVIIKKVEDADEVFSPKVQIMFDLLGAQQGDTTADQWIDDHWDTEESEVQDMIDTINNVNKDTLSSWKEMVEEGEDWLWDVIKRRVDCVKKTKVLVVIPEESEICDDETPSTPPSTVRSVTTPPPLVCKKRERACDIDHDHKTKKTKK